MITFAQSKNSALHRLTAIYNAFLYRFCGAEIVRTDADGLPKITEIGFLPGQCSSFLQ